MNGLYFSGQGNIAMTKMSSMRDKLSKAGGNEGRYEIPLYPPAADNIYEVLPPQPAASPPPAQDQTMQQDYYNHSTQRGTRYETRQQPHHYYEEPTRRPPPPTRPGGP